MTPSIGFPLPRQGVLISLRSKRSALPYDSSVRGPRKSLIFGESGGIERFQIAKRVLCASIAERERNVVGSKLLKLLIFIFFCREQCWRSGIVVCVVVNKIILLVLSVVVSTRI